MAVQRSIGGRRRFELVLERVLAACGRGQGQAIVRVVFGFAK